MCSYFLPKGYIDTKRHMKKNCLPNTKNLTDEKEKKKKQKGKKRTHYCPG